jgi:hypothetical protein
VGEHLCAGSWKPGVTGSAFDSPPAPITSLLKFGGSAAAASRAARHVDSRRVGDPKAAHVRTIGVVALRNGEKEDNHEWEKRFNYAWK